MMGNAFTWERSSLNVRQRLSSNKLTKLAARRDYYACGAVELVDYEQHYVNKFDPKYNIRRAVSRPNGIVAKAEDRVCVVNKVVEYPGLSMYAWGNSDPYEMAKVLQNAFKVYPPLKAMLDENLLVSGQRFKVQIIEREPTRI